jgi:hypothetical protein
MEGPEGAAGFSAIQISSGCSNASIWAGAAGSTIGWWLRWQTEQLASPPPACVCQILPANVIASSSASKTTGIRREISARRSPNVELSLMGNSASFYPILTALQAIGLSGYVIVSGPSCLIVRQPGGLSGLPAQ